MALRPRTKTALLAAGILLFFLGLMLAVLPTLLINRAETKAAIQRYFSTAWGAEISYDRAKLTLFPRVCAAIDDVRLDLPERLSAQATQIDFCLKLMPLLRGRVVVDAASLQSPEIDLALSAMGFYATRPDALDPRRLLSRAMAELQRFPDCTIEITDGRLSFSGSDESRFEFRRGNLQAQRRGTELQWKLDGESDFFTAFSSDGRIDVNSVKSAAAFRISDFRPQPIYAFFWPDAPIQLIDARVDLDIALSLEGPEQLDVMVKGKAPVLSLRHTDHETRVSIERWTAELNISPKKLTVSIPELVAGEPYALIEVSLVVDEETRPRIDLRLKGRGDVGSTRQTALALLHDSPDGRRIFDILRGGEVHAIRVNLQGDSWRELADPASLRIEGRIENGNVYLPWIDLDLNEVSGDARIAGGILEGRGLKARYQGTRGENGTLRVGLSPADPVLQLDIFARAELSALPPFLARVIPDPVFRREVAALQAFSGTAQGTLRLNGTHADVSVEVQAAELDVKARHPLIAYPLRFQGGEFAYDGVSIALRGVDVTIGNSTLFKHDLTLGLKENLPLESRSPKAVIDLAEVFSLIRDRPSFNHLRRLEGLVTFNHWQFRGQALSPGTWRLISTGTVQDLSVESNVMPGPLSLASGSFDWLGQTVRYQGEKASISRSGINGLAFEADWTGPARVQFRALELDASIEDLSHVLPSFPQTAADAAVLHLLSGSARMRDVKFQAKLLPEGPILEQFAAVLKDSVITSAVINPPLTLANGRLSWEGAKFDFKAARASQGQSEIQNLSFSADWNIEGDLELRADAARIVCEEVFPQLVSASALESLRDDLRGIQGTLNVSDVSLKGPIRDPGRWRIQAESELKGIVLTTTFLDDPIELPQGGLTIRPSDMPEAGLTHFYLEATRVRIGKDEAVLTGDVTTSAAGIRLDLGVVAEAADWNAIAKISDRIAKHRKGGSRPASGRLALRAERLTVDRFQFNPFYADATLAEETKVKIERAGFCGMLFIGRVAFDGPVVDAYLVPVVDVASLDSVVTCLSRETSIYTGNFNLNGALQVKARREDIGKALSGELSFAAEDGTIRQSIFFARLFALLNLTEIYRGSLPDFSSQGLDYQRMSASIELKEGKIRVNDWTINGRTLWIGSRGEIDIATQQIDFTIMVSPFKTIDRIINSIPGLRWILGGRLVAIPMRAIGSLEDPQIVPLSPSAVGTSILEMIERTLLLPITIIQPLVPGIEETPGGTIRR